MSNKKFTPTPSNKKAKPKGILELERFTAENITQWNYASENLNELEDVLYFNLEPERRRLRPDLISSLKSVGPSELKINNWSRVVSYEHSAEPLSCLGSLQSYGGRFNVGQELDSGTLSSWPALYIAETYETAFREKRQIASESNTEGLTPSELALQPGENLSSISVQGSLYRVFDMKIAKSLEPISKILRKIKMPDRAKILQKRLRISARDLFMITNSKQLHDAICKGNWRVLPIQFGLPSQSQIIAELIKSAGYEAILYPSSKGTGECLSIFPEQLTDHSYIEITGRILGAVKHRKLDSSSAPNLTGKELKED